MFALLILLSQKQDPIRNESSNLIKICKCVGFFWRVDELLCMIYLSLFFPWMWTIFLPFFLFLFFPLWTCLVGMWHTFLGYASFLFVSFFLTCLLSMWHTFFGYTSFISFCIAHILDGHFREKELRYVMEFYFVGR